MKQFVLHPVPGLFAVVKLPPGAGIPDWATRGAFWSVTATPTETSVLCEVHTLPEGSPELELAGPWRALAVEGPLDFSLTGVLSALAAPLAEAGIPIFATSTYDTDYLLVRREAFEAAVRTLMAAGHTVR